MDSLDSYQRSARKQSMHSLYESGLTLREIGAKFGIGAARVWQIVKEYKYPPRPKRIRILGDNSIQEFRVCFSCKKFRPKFGTAVAKFPLCEDCCNRYMMRSSGKRLEGMDYTREIVRIRDNHTCQSCRNVWKPGERRFDIHHLNGMCGKNSRGYDSLEDTDGLITLCHKCHMNLDEVQYKMANKTSPRPAKWR